MNRFSIFAVLAASLGTSAVASAAEIHVPGDYPTIQQAIDAANVGDEVIVAPGVYLEAIDLPCESITVRSSDGPDVTTIDASGLNDSAVTCICEKWPDGTEIELEGFTITGGTGTPRGNHTHGGGLYNENSSPKISNCNFTGNSTTGNGGGGGGMYNANSSPTVMNCIFSGNSSDFGGAIQNWDNSMPTVTKCLFSANSADTDGGAIYNLESVPTIGDSFFCENTPDHIFGRYNDSGGNLFGPIGCPGDLDHSGNVGVSDFLELLGNWGPCVP